MIQAAEYALTETLRSDIQLLSREVLALTDDDSSSSPCPLCPQIKKTSEATLTTIQDMVTIEDYDVSECFHHSRSTESVKSTVSETYLSKPSIAKRRANQQETEQFYFMVSGDLRRKKRGSWWRQVSKSKGKELRSLL